MQLASPRPFLLGTAVALAIFLVPDVGYADSDDVQFQTTDKVTLKGTFYPGARGKKSACVILLHQLGEDRTKGGLDDLAKKLQEAGFAVLTFDFRGHNESCDVDPAGFWTFPTNRNYLGTNKDRDKIDYKDIKRRKDLAYLPMLANDVAAAKRYLEERNDSGDCNASNLFIVGCKEGAALGALWLAQEAVRPRMIANPNPFGLPLINPKGGTNGDDLAGAVWLSMPAGLSGQSTANFLNNPLVRDRVPMAFLYGAKHEESAKASEGIVNALKRSSKRVPEGTRTHKVEGNGVGMELLSDTGVADVVAYVTKIMKLRAEKPYLKREAEKVPILMIPLGRYGYRGI